MMCASSPTLCSMTKHRLASTNTRQLMRCMRPLCLLVRERRHHLVVTRDGRGYYPFPPICLAGLPGLYEYTTDLLCLNFCRRPDAVTAPALQSVSTPLVVEAWARVLSQHSDRAYARYICTGLKFGFRIGFRQGTRLRSASANMGSAREHPSIVTEYLAKELSLGRMLGPFNPESQIPPVHINRFGVIPKGHNTGKWRLIYRPVLSRWSQR